MIQGRGPKKIKKFQEIVLNSGPHPPTVGVQDSHSGNIDFFQSHSGNIDRKSSLKSAYFHKFRTLDPHPPIVKDFFLKKITFFWMPSLSYYLPELVIAQEYYSENQNFTKKHILDQHHGEQKTQPVHSRHANLKINLVSVIQ